jgi:hypothetical protein
MTALSQGVFRAFFEKVVSKHFFKKRSNLYIAEQINAKALRKAFRDLL